MARIDNTANERANDLHRLTIVEWLEIPSNFRLIAGAAAINQLIIAGSKFIKVDAYKKLSEWLLKKCKTNWDKEKMKNIYESFLGVYKKTVRQFRNTGFGLAQLDVENVENLLMEYEFMQWWKN